uniref:Transcription initiation factor TFIID 150 kDa subunit n=1 Tax=Globodera rostochiensis TaxID=31243 RepID=A0A914HZA3_GLORO
MALQRDTIPSHSDGSLKTFCYQLLVPTSAANIGFAIGDFQMHVQPEMPEIISFVIPELLPLLKHTIFPYSTYWQIFVDQTPDEVTSFAGLSIFSLRVLYHKKILDMVQNTRKLLATAIAQQFFGESRGVFVDRFFGTTEHVYQLNKLLKDSCDYEARFGAVSLRPKTKQSHLYFNPNCPETCSPLHLDALFRKGQLVIRMLEKRLPKEQFIKVLQRVLSLGVQHSQNLDRPAEWTSMLISTAIFLRILTDVTGKELPSFVEQWIDLGGFVSFQVSHTFNRKRNIIELELRQTAPPPKGCQNYTGPLLVVVQELEGPFVHTVQIDAAVSRHDIQCHSKGRKLKKKRIMLGTGEEVDVDLNSMDADSPLLWIRVDPEMLLVNQPFYHWEFMLLHERDVLAQQQAIETLCRFPEHKTKTLLEETVRNDKFFYRIRREAAHCLVQIYNSLPESHLGESPPLIDYIRQNFGSKTSPDVPLPNNYAATASNLQNNLLEQALPSAIGSIRGQGGRDCPRYVLDFIINLIRLNDNSTNRYSDDYYRGALIHALGKTLTMSERTVGHPEELSTHARDVLEEVTHALNMDTMKPSFGRIVSIHCIQVLYELQRFRHLPIDTDIFWKFGQCKGIYAPLRLTALACLVAMIRRSRSQLLIGTVLRLVGLVANDPDPFVRYSVAQRLCANPPFEWTENTSMYPLNTKRLADLLWGIISDVRTETRIRTCLTDLYFILYGLGTPSNFSSF